MLKKTLIVSTVAAGIGLAALPAAAGHRDDRAAGAIIGGTIGALIGSSVHGSDGALVGGLLGAVTGAAAADSRGHYRYGHAYGPRYGYTYATPRYGYYHGYRPVRGLRDADRDGVPNRYDRAPYNPRWR